MINSINITQLISSYSDRNNAISILRSANAYFFTRSEQDSIRDIPAEYEFDTIYQFFYSLCINYYEIVIHKDVRYRIYKRISRLIVTNIQFNSLLGHSADNKSRK